MTQDPERFFLDLAAETEDLDTQTQPAPARLKSRLYSTLHAHLAATGPLLSLSETKAAGRALCVFEAALCAVPVSGSGEPH